MIWPRGYSAAPRAIGYAGLCTVGFLLAGFILRLGVPAGASIPTYTDTLAFYRERADRFSLLFLGSSRIRAHVVPRIVDTSASAWGHSLHSFSIGVDALNLIELNRLVDDVVRIRSPALKHVVIEPVYSTDLPAANLSTERAIYFHDLRNTALEIRCNLSLPAMRHTVGRSVIAASYRLMNVGRLATFHGVERPGSGEEGRLLVRLRQGRGYWPQESIQDEELGRWRRDFLGGLDGFTVKMKEGRSLQAVGRFDMPCHFDAIRAMAGRLRAAGIQPVFVNTPAFLWLGAPLSLEEYLRERGDPTPVLSYIRGHDEFYDPALWYDHRHLTDEGARRFSERLGRDLVPLVAGAPGS